MSKLLQKVIPGDEDLTAIYDRTKNRNGAGISTRAFPLESPSKKEKETIKLRGKVKQTTIHIERAKIYKIPACIQIDRVSN